MKNSQNTADSEIESINPPKKLETEVFAKIDGVLGKENRNKKIFGFSFSFLFLCVLVPVIISMYIEFQQSDFYSYFSLLFTDTHVIMSHATEFILSVTDAVPFIPITIVLSVIFFLMLSMKYAGNIREQFLYTIKH